MKNLNIKTRFMLAIGLQVILLLLVILYKNTVATGPEEVFLRINSEDLRDPIRGDYLSFRYDISKLSLYQFENADIGIGETVYVPLFKSGQVWHSQYAAASKDKPQDNNQVYIKGRVAKLTDLSEGYPTPPILDHYTEADFEKPSLEYPNEYSIIVEIEYGIESYYIPEGAARDAELSAKNVVAKVVIDENGNGVTKQIFVDEKPWP